MYVVRWILAVFLILVSMATWIPMIRIGGVAPDFLLGVVFLIALQKGATWGVWTGVVLGLLAGVESPGTLGADSLALGLAGWLAARSSLGIDRNSAVTQVLLLFLASILAETVRAVFIAGSEPVNLPLFWIRWALPGAIYTTLALPAATWTLCRIVGTRRWLTVAP